MLDLCFIPTLSMCVTDNDIEDANLVEHMNNWGMHIEDEHANTKKSYHWYCVTEKYTTARVN